MSFDATIARVNELCGLIAPPASAAAPTTNSGSSVAAPAAGDPTAFAAQLAGAQQTVAAAPDALNVPPTAGSAGLPATNPFAAQISASAARNGIDPALLTSLIRQESGFNPAASSPAGAQGLTQLMPGTAASLGVTDPLDPAQSIEGGARYLRAQLDHFGGDVPSALAAYNAGPGAVTRFGGVPPYAETQRYVANVMAGAGAGALA